MLGAWRLRLPATSLDLVIEGRAGARVKYGSSVICIDVADTQGCGYILYTHDHHTPRDPRAPQGRAFSPTRFTRVSPGEVLGLEPFIVEVVEAYDRPPKPSIRHPRGFGVGYLIRVNDVSVYHMGDTGLIDELGALRGRVTVLLIPVDPLSAMTPEEAAEAVKTIRPPITVPVHLRDPSHYYKFRDIAQPYTQITAPPWVAGVRGIG